MARRTPPPAATPRPPSPAVLRRRLEAARLEAQAIRAERGLRRLKESAALDYDFLAPWRDLLSARGAGSDWLPIGGPSARRYGTNFPFFQNEQQLSLIRDLSRIVAGTSSHAKGLVRGLTSYTIGTGFRFKVTPRPGAADGKTAAARVTTVLDAWAKRVRWGERQQELYRRTLRDGDGLLVMCPGDDGWLDLRFRWPEQLTQPAGSSFETYGFGVETDPDDAESRYAYWFALLSNSAEGEEYAAADVLHLVDRETDTGIKRGLPIFSFDSKDQLDTASRLARNVGESTAVRAAHAYIRQHAAATEQEVQAFAAAQEDFREPKGFDGCSRRGVVDLPPGAVDDIPDGLEYVGAPSDPGTSAQIAVCDFLARSAGQRVNAPPWLASADASNMGAYTSSLVAESPFVKGVIGDQDYYASRFMRVVDRALAEAVRGGLLDAADVRAVVVSLTPPNPEVRDKDKEAARAGQEIPLGVQSRQAYCAEQGRDFDQVARENQEYQDTYGADGESEPGPAGGPQPKPLRESRDDSGHDHGSDGRFTGSGAGEPGGGGPGARTHTVKLPKRRAALTIDQAAAALKQMGYKIGARRTVLVKGQAVTTSELTHPDGTTSRASADEVREIVYRGAAGTDPPAAKPAADPPHVTELRKRLAAADARLKAAQDAKAHAAARIAELKAKLAASKSRARGLRESTDAEGHEHAGDGKFTGKGGGGGSKKPKPPPKAPADHPRGPGGRPLNRDVLRDALTDPETYERVAGKLDPENRAKLDAKVKAHQKRRGEAKKAARAKRAADLELGLSSRIAAAPRSAHRLGLTRAAAVYAAAAHTVAAAGSKKEAMAAVRAASGQLRVATRAVAENLGREAEKWAAGLDLPPKLAKAVVQDLKAGWKLSGVFDPPGDLDDARHQISGGDRTGALTDLADASRQALDPARTLGALADHARDEAARGFDRADEVDPTYDPKRGEPAAAYRTRMAALLGREDLPDPDPGEPAGEYREADAVQDAIYDHRAATAARWAASWLDHVRAIDPDAVARHDAEEARIADLLKRPRP